MLQMERHTRGLCSLLCLCCVALCSASAQVRSGELRLTIVDPQGLAVAAELDVESAANQYHRHFVTGANGAIDLPTLPFGVYTVRIAKPGFAVAVRTFEVTSPVPLDRAVELAVSGVQTTVNVKALNAEIDPRRPSSSAQIGSEEIQDRVTSLPGRTVQDLIVTQPGWLYEGNAVLHPRGSEYQTQFVLDGIPLTDNRSPSFGPEVEADDLDSLTIYTAGFPAEYGRKLGGVVELNTKADPAPGLHGQLVLAGGSYATAESFVDLQDVVGRNSFGVTASGSRSSHYLNPVVPENYTNNGTTGDFSARFARDVTPTDHMVLNVRHELSRFEIPNELPQQQAGQLQTGDNFETIGTAAYHHVFSPTSLLDLAGMVRDYQNDLFSNAASTPIVATEHNNAREGYLKATFFTQLPHNDVKIGVESDTTFLHEFFAYNITDPTQFDDGTPANLTFAQHRPDLEQGVFVEDLIRLGPYTVSAGLRYDKYQLLLNQNAFSPRLAVSRYFPSRNLLVHFAYDRIFQTPSNENILIASSGQITNLNQSDFLSLPVQPSRGNYYEGGLTTLFARHLKLDANGYRRNVSNYADDDQLLNTGVSYPISFSKAIIYGAEAKLQLLALGRMTGYASYSYQVGAAFYPVSGGLFLGDDADAAAANPSGHFPDSQDQRNTLRTRLQYQASSRFWVAAGINTDSGLPFSFGGTAADALAEYGSTVVNRINFARGRVDPALSLNASASADLYQNEALKVRLQADGTNLTDRLDVIDFGGLFSGNAIAPQRSFHLRLSASY